MAGWDWWNAVKLGCITVGVAALQVLKFALLAEERAHRQRLRGRDGRQRDDGEEKEQGLFANMSPELRRTLVNLIDYDITPILVDQWRLGLVKVMLSPDDGVVLPDQDPETRQALLASIRSYQEAQDKTSAFKAGQTPSRYRSNAPSRQRQDSASTANPRVLEAGPSRPAELGFSRPADPVIVPIRERIATESRPSQTGQAVPSSSHSNDIASSSTIRGLKLPDRIDRGRQSEALQQVIPSAPPITPDFDAPSAPPMTGEDFEMIDHEPAVPESSVPEECGICMDAMIEVEINECHHKLCCECAKAICCLEGRAPQCPFCRGPMVGISAII